MELKEFIKTALADIVSAVRETQEEVKEYATIAPLMSRGEKESAILMKDGVAHVSNIDFLMLPLPLRRKRMQRMA